MHALLDAELGDEDVERLVEDTDDSRRADDRAVALSKVVDEDAEEEVCGLLLRKAGSLLLRVARLSNLRDGLRIEEELGVGRVEQDRLELAVDEDVGVATDRGGEVRIERQVKRVVVVL